MKRALLALGAAVILTGCASGSTLRASTSIPRDRVAYLTVARPSALGWCCAIPLMIDDRVVAKLGAKEYATVEIPAGDHIAAIPEGRVHNFVAFTAAPGEHVYVLMNFVYLSGTDPRMYPAQLGPALVKGLKRVE